MTETTVAIAGRVSGHSAVYPDLILPNTPVRVIGGDRPRLVGLPAG